MSSVGRKSISYWSFAGGLEGTKDIKECLLEAKDKGFEAVELCAAETGVLTPETTKEECLKILSLADEAGLGISSLATGLYWQYSLTDDSEEVRARAKDVTVNLLQIASWLNLDTILVVPGAVDVFFNPDSPVVPYDTVYERSLAALKELAPRAEEMKVNIGLENVWNKFLLSPLEMRDFIDRIDSPYVGCYFDVGNVLLTGYPEQWIKILGKRIKKVHFKDFKRSVGTAEGFCDLLKGDVDWPGVMKAFRETGYEGPFTAEMMPPREDLLQVTSGAMDKILNFIR